MATKHTDSCLKRAGDDEPIFVLRAKDALAPTVVKFWAQQAYKAGTTRAKVAEAFDLAVQMTDWQKKNGCRVPD